MAERWWWSMKHGRAVTDDERGPDLDVLGPYPTREAAEAWRETVDERNQEWQAEDERWDGDDGPNATDGDDGDDGGPAGG